MGTNIFFKFFALIICTAIFTSSIAAQEKLQALKFGEYSDENRDIQSLAKKTEEFAKRLQAEPAATKGYIAYFRGSSYLKRNQEKYGEIYLFLENFAAQNANRINKDDGLQWGGRSLNRSVFARVEFWIIPNDAEKPDIRADECGLFDCPTFKLDGAAVVKNVNEPQVFTANVEGGNEEIEYNWKISEGAIIAGQGTRTITVDFSKTVGKEIKITFELDGVAYECVQEQTITAKIQ